MPHALEHVSSLPHKGSSERLGEGGVASAGMASSVFAQHAYIARWRLSAGTQHPNISHWQSGA